MNYGTTFKAIREAKGMTLKETSKDILSISALSKFENDSSNIGIDYFIPLINRLNITFEEFLYLHDDLPLIDFIEFSQLVKFHYEREDIIFLEELLKEQEILQKKSTNIRYKHNICWLRSLICILKGEPALKEDSNLLWEYLINIDDWYYYELSLYNNVLFIFSIEQIALLSRQAQAKLIYYNKLSLYQDTYLVMLSNTITIMIKRKNYKQAKRFLNLADEENNQSKDLIQINRLNFLRGILNYLESNDETQKDAAIRQIQQSIDILIQLNQTILVKKWKRTLDECQIFL